MTLTVGRLAIEEVATWQQSGDGISISGVLNASSVDGAKVMRQQLSGYLRNPDEPVVPVTWDADATVDGYYRVADAQVSTVPMSLTAGWFGFSLSLERAPGYAAPLMEQIGCAALRVNLHSISAAARHVMAVPEAAVEFYDDTATTSGDVFTRTSADGDVRCAKAAVSAYRLQTYSLAPADYYTAAATIYADAQVVVGDQIPFYEGDWQIDNGLLRLAPSGSGFSIECYDGSQWDTARVFIPTVAGVSIDVADPSSGVRILRNCPEEVIVRVPQTVSSAVLSALSIESVRFDIDIALRRGDRVARITMTSTLSVEFGLENVTTTASTAVGTTAGLRATSATDGNRYVLLSPQAIDLDTTQGGIELTTASTSFRCAVGFEVGGGSAATNDTATQLMNQYFTAGSERQVISVR